MHRSRGAWHTAYEWRATDTAGHLTEDWLYTDTAQWQSVFHATDAADYDAKGRLLEWTAEMPAAAAHEYEYSQPFGFLTNDGVATYTYDDYGNRLTRTEGAVVDTYSYAAGNPPTHDPLHRLQSVTRGQDTVATYAYTDPRGHLTSKTTAAGTTTYTWDGDGRLVSASLPAVGTTPARQITFTYDPLGRRIRRHMETVNTTPVQTEDVHTVWSLASAGADSLPGVAGSLPLADFDGAGNLLREYVWDPQAPGGIGGLVLLRAYVGNDPTDADPLYAEYRPICDFRGNVVALVGMDGALAEWYQYDGFGRVRFFDSQGELTGSVVGNPFLFSTKPYDEALGLYDFGARWYDPETGRFLSPDPLGFVDGPNPYALCTNDPVNAVDPWGLCTEKRSGWMDPWFGRYPLWYTDDCGEALSCALYNWAVAYSDLADIAIAQPLEPGLLWSLDRFAAFMNWFDPSGQLINMQVTTPDAVRASVMAAGYAARLAGTLRAGQAMAGSVERARAGGYLPGEVMADGRVAGVGPGAMSAGEGGGAVAPGVAFITPGSLRAAEEAAVLRTVGHIDAGTVPTGQTATRWAAPFRNWGGDLPGGRGVSSPYLEYRVSPPAGTAGAGTLRVVRNTATGEMYYTWTHYGDQGQPAFVRIR